jgi:hypothetical protein
MQSYLDKVREEYRHVPEAEIDADIDLALAEVRADDRCARFDKLSAKSQAAFLEYLKAQELNIKEMTEEETEAILQS